MSRLAVLFAWISSVGIFGMMLVLTILAIRDGDADAFVVLAFLTLMPLVGLLATWKRNPLLMLFAALVLLPFGLYFSWGFGNSYKVIMGFGLGLFVLSSFLVIGLGVPQNDK